MSKNKISDMKRKNFMRMVIIFQIVYLLVFNGLFASVSILSKAKYLLDIATLILCVGIFLDRRDLYKIKGKAYYIPLSVYSIVCIVTAIVYKTEPLLFLWAVRNTFRFFVFFFACILYVGKDDIKKFFDFLLKLQFANLPLMIIQYFYFKSIPKAERGILADHVSGIFGSEIGGNGMLNIFLCIILIYVLTDCYDNNKLKPMHILSLANVMVCAAFSELKFFFFESAVIYLICGIFYCRKIAENPKLFIKLTSLFILFLASGFILIYGIYPYTKRDLSNLSRYEQGTKSEYRLGRVHAFSNINEIFFNNSVIKNLLGLGFGNCEYSSFRFLVSDFYSKYGDYNYRWFSHQMLYLETGAVGFVSFARSLLQRRYSRLLYFTKNPKTEKLQFLQWRWQWFYLQIFGTTILFVPTLGTYAISV